MIDQLLRQALSVHGRLWSARLTRSQYAVLEVLDVMGPRKQGDLVDALIIDRSTLSQIVRDLRASHSILAERDGKDKRAWIIRISTEGRKELIAARKQSIRAQRDFLKLIPKALDRELFTSYLERICREGSKL